MPTFNAIHAIHAVSRAGQVPRGSAVAGSPSAAFQRPREVEPGQTHRRWSIRTPDGKCWSVTQTPPATAGEMARSWPAGTALEPLPDVPIQPGCPALDSSLEARIRAWLAHIGERDERIIAEVLSRCRHEPDVLRMYLALADDALVENPLRDANCCGTCLNYQRTTHPHLGHCQAGEPEPAGGLWDTTPRSCDQWGMKP